MKFNFHINIGPQYRVENSRHVAIGDVSNSSLPTAKCNPSYCGLKYGAGLTALMLLVIVQIGWSPKMLDYLNVLKAAMELASKLCPGLSTP